MDYRQLGRAGVRVSPYAVGTANFGWVTPETDAHEILDLALEHGVNLFDTASNYNAGLSEEILGRWLARQDRDKVVVATKVFYPPNRYASRDPDERAGTAAGPNGWGLSARHIITECEASLRRLGLDHIDLYQLHHVDRCTPVDEIWQALDTLVAQGKIIYVGTSNHAGWHISRMCEVAHNRSSYAPVSEQCPYNLRQRGVELEVVPACEYYGLGLLPYSPLAGGALSGTSGAVRGKHANRSLPPEDLERIDQFTDWSGARGLDPAVIAVSWLLTRPAVSAVILGPRTSEHLIAALSAHEIVLDDSALEELDRIFPGPGVPAPEAYAR